MIRRPLRILLAALVLAGVACSSDPVVHVDGGPGLCPESPSCSSGSATDVDAGAAGAGGAAATNGGTGGAGGAH